LPNAATASSSPATAIKHKIGTIFDIRNDGVVLYGPCSGSPKQQIRQAHHFRINKIYGIFYFLTFVGTATLEYRFSLYSRGRRVMSGEPPRRCEFNSDDLLIKLDLMLPADENAVPPIIEKIMAVIQEMECSAGYEFEINLALYEALANAIKHGSKHDPSKQIQCSVACDRARGMLIIVRDPGPGFDPSSIPSPIVGQNLFASGGRGIYLINQLMDDVRFEKGGTEIHMRMNPPIARKGTLKGR
jgi:serine/threonine-protein kinase RsbW